VKTIVLNGVTYNVSVQYDLMYRVGQKRTVLRVDNFVTVSDR